MRLGGNVSVTGEAGGNVAGGKVSVTCFSGKIVFVTESVCDWH